MSAHAARYRFADIDVGLESTADYPCSPGVAEAFLSSFGDHSPLHVDDDYARARGFAERVVHGGVLHGFLSHFIGMRFPGRGALLLSVDMRYTGATHVGDLLRLKAVVKQKVESQRSLVLAASFENVTRGWEAGRSKVLVKMTDEQ